MGVDLDVFMATGYVIECNLIEHINFDDIYDDDLEGDVGFNRQDCYGNKDGDACLILYDRNTINYLWNGKVGSTPMSFKHDQIYTGNEDAVKGGAQKYITLSLEFLPLCRETDPDLCDVRDKINNYCSNSNINAIRELGEMLKDQNWRFSRWLFSSYY